MSADIDPDLGVLTAEDWDAGRRALGVGAKSVVFGTSRKVLNSLVQRFKDQASVNSAFDKRTPDEKESRARALFVHGDVVIGPEVRDPVLIPREFIEDKPPRGHLPNLVVEYSFSSPKSRDADEFSAAEAPVDEVLIWRKDDTVVLTSTTTGLRSVEFTVDGFREFVHKLKSGSLDELLSSEQHVQRRQQP